MSLRHVNNPADDTRGVGAAEWFLSFHSPPPPTAGPSERTSGQGIQRDVNYCSLLSRNKTSFNVFGFQRRLSFQEKGTGVLDKSLLLKDATGKSSRVTYLNTNHYRGS